MNNNIKLKKCKGSHKYTYGLGCGEMVKQSNRVYGLGKKCGCYRDWLKTDFRAQEYIKSRVIPKARKFIKEKEQEKTKEEKKRIRELKIKNMSADKYRATYVQPLVNKIARLIDYGQPCTPTGNFEGKMAGGHYTAIGTNRTICLNLHNIFIQSFHSNSWKGGDSIRYRNSIRRIFGNEYLIFIEGLNSHPPVKLRKEQLIEIKEKCSSIIRDLEYDLKVLSPEERIQKRNEINLELGIYQEKYCQFKTS